MKSLLLGSAALLALGTIANAADLSPKTYTKAPVAAPTSNWTGFYLSGGGGYGLWEADQRTDGDAVTERNGGRGWFGTVGGGYDYQFNSSWVAGLFADAQFGDMKGSVLLGATEIGTTKNNLSYAAGVRLGYLVAPNVLSYVNAGYSHADFTSAELYLPVLAEPAGETASKLHADGWFIGGGVENSLDFFGISAPGWFMKTEYRVAEYGRKSVNVLDDASGAFVNSVAVKPYVQTVSTSLVYRFNSHVVSGADAATPLYTKAARASAFNWTGFYLAGGGGYGLWAADEHHSGGGFDFLPTRVGGRGYFGTVGGGYDWQFAPRWVAGIFADAQFGDIKGSHAFPSDVGSTRNDLNYAAGVRAGYLIAPNALSYINGGYTHANFTRADYVHPSDGAPSTLSFPKTGFDGWFLGGGVENSLDMFGLSFPGWFMKTEYRVAEYNEKTVSLLDGGVPSTSPASFKPYVQTISTSLVYRFNWTGGR